jgi:hypothetical protein
MHPERCLICGSFGSVTLFSYDAPDCYETEVGVGADGFARAWVRCSGCNFHYSQYSRDRKILNRIYEVAYRDARSSWRTDSPRETFDTVVQFPIEQSETKQRVQWIKRQLEDLATGGRFHMNGAPCSFLDIGGANAIFSHEFQDSRWRAHVMDPSEAGAALCAELDIPYANTAIEDAGGVQHFNLVTMTYVLEHLRDPGGAIRAARQLVAEKGAVFIEVPDAACFDTRPADDDIFNACHLWMFSLADLGRLLCENGFELVAEERGTSVRGHESLKVLAVPA